MPVDNLGQTYTQATLQKLFPPHRADQFFEAMYGDVSEGAYDIQLTFQGLSKDTLEFLFNLRKRPGKCLACNLTYGLPEVFSRHPVININGLVEDIKSLLNRKVHVSRWALGQTQERSSDLHVIPLTLFLDHP